MKSLTTTAFALFAILTAFSQSSTLNRPNDPVVLTGADLPVYNTLSPAAIVGFKYFNGAWSQIPIQVDERALKDIVTPYGSLAAQAGYPPASSNPKIYFYTDPATNTGGDVGGFDADDELVFMAKDAGGQFAGSVYPAGVVSGSCTQVTIADPLGGIGYVYLFQNDGSLSQDAGISYVSYSFNSSGSGMYPAHVTGTNNENSTISTSKYSWHFAAEWVSDELRIALGTNTDILDRHKNFYANGNCIRSENTFSAGENAYVTNKTGPIRVIRSYMGANSGPLTQRTHLFYQGRHDIITDMRVHNIVSMVDAFDYNSSASGMTYRNSLNTNGVVINGVQDNPVAGDISWEMVSGAPGSLVILQRRATTLTGSEATFSSYYDDKSSSPASNCTGDAQAWGTSGTVANFLNGSVCTDPMANGCAGTTWYRTLQVKRVLYVEPPNANATVATNYNDRYNNPFQITIAGCPATPTNYSVALASSPASGGSVNGAGNYVQGTLVAVTASANSNYSFVNWTEGANVVSNNSSYSFNINNNRSLVANFSPLTSVLPASRNGSVYAVQSRQKILFKNMAENEVYTISIFNNLGQLVARGKVNKASPTINLNIKGIVSVIITSRKSSSRFQMLLLD